jgi:acetamidase/formamidase
LIHELPVGADTAHGFFSRQLPPVLSVVPGDSVRFAAPQSTWLLESRERLVSRDPSIHDGHALVGPIDVRGAQAGQTLVVRVDEVAAGSWGHTYTEFPHLLDWELGGGVARWRGHEVPLAPFLGVMGMPPPEDGRHSTRPPRRWGGNLDCKELVAGSTLFLPIPVDGALFSAGDGHAAQGDGEVAGTAIEAPVEAQLTLDVRDDLPLEWPIARLDGAWLTFGLDEHLGLAARKAVDGMLALMEREHGLPRLDALGLATAIVDLRVTQVVNGTLGVHAILRDEALR